MAKKRNISKSWSIQDSQQLYRINRWGAGYYMVNEQGNICVCPSGNKRRQIDLKNLVDDLRERHIQPPVLIRFMDVLSDRIKKITRCFNNARKEFGYEGQYHPVYPIKVNQQRQVVEAMIEAGRGARLGLEVGSKPELLTVLACAPDSKCLVICNGYKDHDYIRMALCGQQLGLRVILVAEKLSEVKRIVSVAEEMGVKPMIGIRIKLTAEGTGRWATSAGDKSKFGPRISELMHAIAHLREHEMLASFQLIHFHIGSQISQIDNVKTAMTEVARIYSELTQMSINIKYVDVGGGLGVDYDGTSSSSPASVNYSVQEYANDIVFAMNEICTRQNLPNPHIITESGRALTAHYSVLITNLVDSSSPSTDITRRVAKGAPEPLPELQFIYDELNPENCREFFHDAVYLRRQVQNRFNVGSMTLADRALAEELYWAIMTMICNMVKEKQVTHQEFEGLEKLLASTYFANFSLFQSLPDSWAIDQLFPIIPIQRLDEKPDHLCTLADITCDSDGKIEGYISEESDGHCLPIHATHSSEDYYVGFFLVGAYQEILGDLHNLFGDTNAVHVKLDNGGNAYRLAHVIHGDSVKDVLGYLQYNSRELLDRLRGKLERAVQRQDITVSESASYFKLWEQGFNSYTYLEH